MLGQICPVKEGAYQSSLYLKDNNTLVLNTARNFTDVHSEVWWKAGLTVNI